RRLRTHDHRREARPGPVHLRGDPRSRRVPDPAALGGMSAAAAPRPARRQPPHRLARVKVLSVVGNRPQFVKSAPLSLALRESGVEEVVLHTGQHYDPELSQVFFDELALAEPDYRLDLHTAD